MLNQNSARQAMTPPLPYDRWLVLLVVSIVAIGLLMVASASIVISAQQMHQPFYYFYRQVIYLTLGIVLGGIVVQFEIETWEKISGVLLIGTMLGLALVLLPGIGHAVNGSARWIHLGFLNIQVSEIAKFAVIIFLAGYLVRRNEEIRTQFSGFIKPLGILAVLAVLLLREPDFGATAVIVATALGMMFMAGMRLRDFSLLMLLVLVGFSVLAVSAPYRLERLTTFLNPWSNPFASGYQLTQSLIAFGRGGWFGVGLGNSIQKLFYLPEAHTDFLFAVIAEEFGLIGMMVVIFLYSLLIWRIFIIGRQAQRLGEHYSGYLAYGFALWIAIQFTISIGVNSGVFPTKGLTLPLMSSGGSSLIVNCVMMAVLFRIDYENRLISLGLK